jgi:hypothetical protein
MLIGYNTNIPYKGRVYHVQTEDSGLNNPCIITLLYYQGAILRSAKTGYSQIIGTSDFEEQLRNLMKHQHREMIRALITGKCDPEQTGRRDAVAQAGEEKDVAPVMPDKKEAGAKERTKSLDEILLEHISRKVKK